MAAALLVVKGADGRTVGGKLVALGCTGMHSAALHGAAKARRVHHRRGSLAATTPPYPPRHPCGLSGRPVAPASRLHCRYIVDTQEIHNHLKPTAQLSHLSLPCLSSSCTYVLPKRSRPRRVITTTAPSPIIDAWAHRPSANMDCPIHANVLMAVVSRAYTNAGA